MSSLLCEMTLDQKRSLSMLLTCSRSDKGCRGHTRVLLSGPLACHRMWPQHRACWTPHNLLLFCGYFLFFFQVWEEGRTYGKRERERKEGSRQKIQTNHEPGLVQPLYSLEQLLYSEPFRLPSEQAFLSAYIGKIPPNFSSQNMVFYPIYTYFLYVCITQLNINN